MSFRQLLWACNRRWRLLVLVTAFAMVLGLVTAPSQADVLRKQRESLRYRATHLLVVNGPRNSASLPRLVLDATSGAIPTSVAEKLGDDPESISIGKQGVRQGGGA